MGDDEQTVEQYRIDQLEAELAALRSSTKTLNFDQIKQMFTWIGLPVGLATTVFGAALWISMQDVAGTAAEGKAERTLGTLSSQFERLSAQMETLTAETDQTSTDLSVLKGRAEAMTEFVAERHQEAQRQAELAQDEFDQLRATVKSADTASNALANTTEIAKKLSDNSEFSKVVAGLALDGLNGLVAAFDRRTGCPAGWAPFEEANGRVILGVGQGSIDRIGDQDIPLTPRRWREFGGEEEVVLSEAQMPPHSHKLVASFKENGLAWATQASSHRIPTNERTTKPDTDWIEGRGKAHPNMPPFIALYFCKKT